MRLAKLSASATGYGETAGKVAILAIFSLAAKQKLLAIVSLLQNWSAMDEPTRWVYLAADITAFAFVLLVLVATLFRHRPLQTADGFEPWISAMVGTFLAATFALLPRSEIPLSLIVFAVAMSATGGLLSAYVLLWLGRSFSITAQARKLVTSGPYALIRHPLYFAEEFMVLGMMILVLSPLAVMIAGIHWAFQLRRMINEEKVLRAAYPDYGSYSARTPRIIPHLSRLHQLQT